jgi:hypothetical protein
MYVLLKRVICLQTDGHDSTLHSKKNVISKLDEKYKLFIPSKQVKNDPWHPILMQYCAKYSLWLINRTYK